MNKATVVDIAAYLGVTPRRVQQVITEHRIGSTGRKWKALLYDPRMVIRCARMHRPDTVDGVGFHSTDVRRP